MKSKHLYIFLIGFIVVFSSCNNEFKWEQKSPDASILVEITATRKIALDPFRTKVFVKNASGANISFEFEWMIDKPSNDHIILQWNSPKEGILSFTYSDKSTRKFIIKDEDQLQIIPIN